MRLYRIAAIRQWELNLFRFDYVKFVEWAYVIPEDNEYVPVEVPVSINYAYGLKPENREYLLKTYGKHVSSLRGKVKL